jgi:hypothetical protein
MLDVFGHGVSIPQRSTGNAEPNNNRDCGASEMIQETCTRIEELEDFWTSEIRARHARRNKIREIDDLLNQFEMLNLADDPIVPRELGFRVAAFIRAEEHPLSQRSPETVPIQDWMEALYEVQDGLMIRFPDDID